MLSAPCNPYVRHVPQIQLNQHLKSIQHNNAAVALIAENAPNENLVYLIDTYNVSLRLIRTRILFTYKWSKSYALHNRPIWQPVTSNVDLTTPESIWNPLLSRLHVFADGYVISRASAITRQKVTPEIMASYDVILAVWLGGTEVLVLRHYMTIEFIILVPKGVKMTMEVRQAIIAKGQREEVLPIWLENVLLSKNPLWSP